MKKLSFIILNLSFSVVLFLSCDPEGTSERNTLFYWLNGYTLTADQLLDSLHSIGANLPATNADTRPRTDGDYVNTATGSRLHFSTDSTADGGKAIGTVTIVQIPAHDILQFYGDTTVTMFLQSRGRGLYTPYYIDESEDYGTRRVWEPVVFFVQPDGKSMITTRGHVNSQRTLQFESTH